MISSVERLFKPTKYPDIYKKLCSIIGERYVSSRGVDRLAYSRDVWPVSLKMAQLNKYPYIPEIVVWPSSVDEISSILSLIEQNGMKVIPYSGGSGSVGGTLPLSESILVDLKRMDKIIHLDDVSLTVTVEAGKIIQDLEDELNAAGFTLGHFPQSMHSACVGGSIAHNGIGTFSTKYGKFDDMVLGMQVVIPDGSVLDILPVPKSSTGPNLNEVFLGSEGTLGIVTSATLKIHHEPELRLFRSYSVSDIRIGLDLIRELIQHDLKPAVVRLYDEIESESKFEALNMPGTQCLLNLCFEGFNEIVELEDSICAQICKSRGAKYLGREIGEYWFTSKRFDVTGYIDHLIEPKHICETLEVSSTWVHLADLYYEIREVMLKNAFKVMGHSSHVYPQGGNLYMIFFAELESLEEEAIWNLYRKVLDDTFHVCKRLGAAISHHHGIGIAKSNWMILQHGQAGMKVMQSMKKAIDPGYKMNPGKLGFDVEE
jgi:alkyldihydroxyacetonephosphate synthase